MYVGEKENEEGMLRSIYSSSDACMEYSCIMICKWDDSGVPFRTYIDVPEKHPLTGSELHK